MNFAFAPTTLTTGCSPIVFVTTPPHPASNARRMLLSDSVGGAEESRNGFSKWIPVKVVERSAMVTPDRASSSLDAVDSPFETKESESLEPFKRLQRRQLRRVTVVSRVGPQGQHTV